MHASTEFFSCKVAVKDQHAAAKWLAPSRLRRSWVCSASRQPAAVWNPRPPPHAVMRTLITEFHKPALRKALLSILVSPGHRCVEGDWCFVFKQARMFVKLPLGENRDYVDFQDLRSGYSAATQLMLEPEKLNCEARRTSPPCTPSDHGAPAARGHLHYTLGNSGPSRAVHPQHPCYLHPWPGLSSPPRSAQVWLVGASEPVRSGLGQGKKAPLGQRCWGAVPRPGNWRVPGHRGRGHPFSAPRATRLCRTADYHSPGHARPELQGDTQITPVTG